ncbi:MAG TPA: MFS transporter [Rhodopila sp.]|uniref:MFS transporter n=1 Tax=Rhodopila sp. TaxID=2480087 RepID=UPI002B968A12|nr:MFS transporter [Rhodopila sp.]HVY16181.1 MFS transporter [Rhodopila sp.]
MRPSAPEGSEFARGWTVVLAASVGVGLGITGVPIYTIGQFVRPLAEAFGWSRATIAGGLTVLTACGVLTAPLVGVLAERFGVRRVAIAGMIGLAAGFLGLSLSGGSVEAYYLGWAALAILGAGTSPIVWTAAVASWFERNRGLALGITLCGTGVVAVVAPAVVGGIIGSFGWRAAFGALAAAQIVIGLPVVLPLFRSRVSTPATSEVPDTPRSGMTLRDAAASTRFWRLILAFFLMAMVIGGLIVNLPAMLADRGVDFARASAALGLLGVAVILGRLTVGFLVDRLAAQFVAAVYIALPSAACLLLARHGSAVPAVVLTGLAAGAEVDLLAFLIGRYFGLLHYARIYGWALSAFSAGIGVGPVLAARVRDTSGSYGVALYMFAAMAATAALLVASLGGGRQVTPAARR